MRLMCRGPQRQRQHLHHRCNDRRTSSHMPRILVDGVTALRVAAKHSHNIGLFPTPRLELRLLPSFLPPQHGLHATSIMQCCHGKRPAQHSQAATLCCLCSGMPRPCIRNFLARTCKNQTCLRGPEQHHRASSSHGRRVPGNSSANPKTSQIQ